MVVDCKQRRALLGRELPVLLLELDLLAREALLFLLGSSLCCCFVGEPVAHSVEVRVGDLFLDLAQQVISSGDAIEAGKEN